MENEKIKKKRGRPKKAWSKVSEKALDKFVAANSNNEALPNFYNLILETVGLTYKSTGASIDEALANLGLEWHQLKNKGVVKVEHNGKKLEYLFYLKQLRRIFANKITRLMWGKRLELLMKESDGDLKKNIS